VSATDSTLMVTLGTHQNDMVALRDQLIAEGIYHGDVATMLSALTNAKNGADGTPAGIERVRRFRRLLDEAIEKARSNPAASLSAASVAKFDPATITQPGIRAAVEAYQTVEAAARDARREVASLERQRPKALAADTDALADAIANGQKDPGQKHADKLDADVRDAKRRADARAVNQQRALEALHRALREHGGEWREQIAQAERDARARYTAALEGFESASADLSAAVGLSRFAAGGAKSGHPIALSVPAPRHADDRVGIHTLLSALRTLTRKES